MALRLRTGGALPQVCPPQLPGLRCLPWDASASCVHACHAALWGLALTVCITRFVPHLSLVPRDVERAAAMERWAGHVAAAEGRPWAAAGLLVAAGALKSALLLLRQVCPMGGAGGCGQRGARRQQGLGWQLLPA